MSERERQRRRGTDQSIVSLSAVIRSPFFFDAPAFFAFGAFPSAPGPEARHESVSRKAFTEQLIGTSHPTKMYAMQRTETAPRGIVAFSLAAREAIKVCEMHLRSQIGRQSGRARGGGA